MSDDAGKRPGWTPGWTTPERNRDCANCVRLKEQRPELANWTPKKAQRIRRGSVIYWTALCEECSALEARRREAIRIRQGVEARHG